MTTWYPSDHAPQSALFVQRDVEVLARRHDVHVIHLTPFPVSAVEATVTWHGVPVTRIPMSPGSPIAIIRATRRLRKLLEDYEVLHTMALSTLLPFALFSARMPWIHTEHWSGIVAPETVPRVMRVTLPLTLRLIRRPRVVVAVSAYLAAKIGRVRSGPIRVIPNAVMRPETLVERHAELSPLRLIAVGGLVPRKGPDIALAALAELRVRGIDAELRWIGDGPMRAELGAEAERLGVGEHVEWAGSQSPDDVSQALSDSDILLLPTKNETFGVAIAEALAHGRPVVVGATGGQTEFVHPPYGMLVAERTPKAYADAIARIVEATRELTAAQIAGSLGFEYSENGREQAYADAYASISEQRREG